MLQKDKTQLQRLIFIDRQIRDGMRCGRYANCHTMAREYEVSTKSIQRDLDYLKYQCDAPIEYDSSKKGYYYSEENFKMPAVQINASDLFAISLAEKVLKQHEDTPIYQKLVSVFKKIEESLPEKVAIHPAWIDNRISIIQQQKTTILPEIWSSVADALQRNRTLTISYRKPGAPRARSRDVDPYHLVNFQGEWYLVGFCHLRGKILTFSISRIKTTFVTSQGFTVQAGFDFKNTSTRFGIFSGDHSYRVKIRFEKQHAAYVREREWHPSQELSPQKDGGLIFAITTSHLFEIRQWVLSWGAGVRVLEPPELVEQVKDELGAALRQYQNGDQCLKC